MTKSVIFDSFTEFIFIFNIFRLRADHHALLLHKRERNSVHDGGM